MEEQIDSPVEYNDEYKSESMKEFPNFKDFLAVQRTYEDVKGSVMKINLNIGKTEHKFSLNLKKREIVYWEVNEAPDGWEDHFNEAELSLDSAIENVNLFLRAGKRVWPPREKLFRALELVKPEDVKVVILGQDPYPQPNVADGLAFSCPGFFQKSLQTISKEIQRTDEDKLGLKTTDLTFWALQGVLLLNTCLTVNENDPKSHKNIWKPFIFEILQKLLQETEHHIFLVLWGGQAKQFIEGTNKLKISSKKVTVLKAGHPSPINTSKTSPFAECNHFAIINERLREDDDYEIDWTGHHVLED